MSPTTETADYIEYAGPGFTYRVNKTSPPTFVVTFDYSHPRYADKPQTWQAVKAEFDLLEDLT